MNTSRGFVSLIGAGPGDPGLLTIKAQKRLQEADLIVYDYLCNPEHLRHAKKGALVIGVGKGFRHKAMSQDRINRLILAEAKKGHHVARLKGGDPYLFGRGGEEALYVRDHGINFEVIPGVTSATACAAFAGIPLTHRDHNSSVTFLTGHRANDTDLDTIPWKKIVDIGGTLVIYMGFYNLQAIAKHLIEAGMPASTPAAVIQWGTLPYQKTASGPLSQIYIKATQKKLSAPSIIIIGDVVSLRTKLDWFSKLPLFGKKIMISRPAQRSGTFRDKLEALGAEVIEIPLIEIAPTRKTRALDKAIRQLKQYSWVVFASVYGVEYFFARLRFLGFDARYFHEIKIAAVGSETAKALTFQGLCVDYIPKDFQLSSLADTFSKKGFLERHDKILFPRTGLAGDDLGKHLSLHGIAVDQVTAYETLCPRTILPALKSRLFIENIDYLVFTSASTANHFSRLLGTKKAKQMASRSRILSIGPVTSKAIKSLGLKVYREAYDHTTDGLIQVLCRKQS